MLTRKAIYFYCGKYKNNEKTTLKKSCIVFPVFFFMCDIYKTEIMAYVKIFCSLAYTFSHDIKWLLTYIQTKV